MSEVTVEGKRRGRRKANESAVEYVPKLEQRKFIADLSDDEDQRQLVIDCLSKANQKDFGREILFRDVVNFAFSKLTDKDFVKIHECSLSSKEKALRVVSEYNQKHGTNLSLEEFILLRDGK